MITWMKSCNNTWHIVGRELRDGMILPKCQSYNMDKPNWLHGLIKSDVSNEVHVCKKCSSRNKVI